MRSCSRPQMAIIVAATICSVGLFVGRANAFQTIANGIWELVTVEPAPNTLLSADFATPDDGWAMGIYGQLLKWDGKSWSPFVGSRNLPHSLLAVKFLAPNDGWAVGGSGLILHWDGARWNNVPSPTEYDLYGLAFVSPQLGWAVGGRSGDIAYGDNPDRIILNWNGRTWEKVTSPISSPLNWGLVSIGMSSAQDGWAVGDYIMLRWDGSRWQEYPSAFDIEFQAVVSLSSQDAWIVGDDYTTHEGVILHWDGNQWAENHRSKLGLRGIVMVTPDFGWAVGGNNVNTLGGSVILHWDGNTWAEMSAPTRLPLKFVWANNKSDGWILAGGDNINSGFEGAILRYVPPPIASATTTVRPTAVASSSPFPTLTSTAILATTLTPSPSLTPLPSASPPIATSTSTPFPSASGPAQNLLPWVVLVVLLLLLVGGTMVLAYRRRRE